MEFSRLDPMREMASIREEIDRLFDSFFGRALRFRRDEEGEWTPIMDVEETADAFTIIVELPGMRKEDIELSISGDRISVSGDRKREVLKGATFHRLERSFGKFRRTVSLPSQVNADAAKAVYKDGTLILTLPKAEKATPEEITIDVK